MTITEKTTSKEVAKFIKDSRIESGKTQVEMAEILGISQARYASIERGDNWITINNLVKILEVFGKKLDME